MSARSVQIISGGVSAEVDSIAGGLVTIDSVHKRIHDGQLFSASSFVLELADDAVSMILIRVASFAHMALQAGCGGNAEIEFFEGTTTSADGSALATPNHNRASATVATTLVFSGPTPTGDGTELGTGFIPGGTGGNAIGGSTSSFAEWILDANDYMVRLTNRAGTTQPASIQVVWYEP
jgi:hypothetical protein